MRPHLLAGFLSNEKNGSFWSLLNGRSGWGNVFFCFLWTLHDLLAKESDGSGNDGVGKLFWGTKKLEFLLFLGGN